MVYSVMFVNTYYHRKQKFWQNRWSKFKILMGFFLAQNKHNESQNLQKKMKLVFTEIVGWQNFQICAVGWQSLQMLHFIFCYNIDLMEYTYTDKMSTSTFITNWVKGNKNIYHSVGGINVSYDNKMNWLWQWNEIMDALNYMYVTYFSKSLVL